MKNNKVLTTGLGLLIAVTGAFGLTACSSDDSAAEGSSESTQADVDVAEDLENARKAVADALAEDDSWAQIMLASDVEAPTVKYGLLVVPYSFSEAAARVQGTITITDGEYTIDADSAATEKTWQIDQDGTITEVTE
ncbi:hypothetical protein [Pengzhenrongella frigida]|uniref:Uncharacterized protein n=1 Tax=Pengzhenrongella frigida TaxID=1259133 RepID=A0A4Q5N7C2_9MICO|nr:hypothetical protein [Cellulomonas sp. HLT2-17]RYV53027.1 hypothetical protein EUA98_00665 [Cellulomonas sp. HLT2-17]